MYIYVYIYIYICIYNYDCIYIYRHVVNLNKLGIPDWVNKYWIFCGYDCCGGSLPVHPSSSTDKNHCCDDPDELMGAVLFWRFPVFQKGLVCSKCILFQSETVWQRWKALKKCSSSQDESITNGMYPKSFPNQFPNQFPVFIPNISQINFPIISFKYWT